LVSSVEDGLTCAVLGVQVADLIDVLGRHGGLHHDDPRRQTLALAQPLGRMVSPLSLTPRVPMPGRFIYGGVVDRLVHPRDQVMRLWEHWGQSRDRLVPRRAHRVLQVASGPGLHRLAAPVRPRQGALTLSPTG